MKDNTENYNIIEKQVNIRKLMSSQEISVLCKSLRYRLLQREFVPIAIYLKRV